MERVLILEEGESETWDIRARWSGMEEEVSIHVESVDSKGLEISIYGIRRHATKVHIKGELSSYDVFLNSLSFEKVIKERLGQLIQESFVKNSNKIIDLIWNNIKGFKDD